MERWQHNKCLSSLDSLDHLWLIWLSLTASKYRTHKVIKKSMEMNSRTYLSLAITLIWLNAESFNPVMSRTLTQVVIGRPFFLDIEGCNSVLTHYSKKETENRSFSQLIMYSPVVHGLCIRWFGCVIGHSSEPVCGRREACSYLFNTWSCEELGQKKWSNLQKLCRMCWGQHQ